MEIEAKLLKAKESASTESECKIAELAEKCEQLEREKAVLISQRDATRDAQGVEVKQQSARIHELERKVWKKLTAHAYIAYIKLQLASAERSLKEVEVCEKARLSQMANDFEDNKGKMGAMRQALVELDDQCERLMVSSVVWANRRVQCNEAIIKGKLRGVDLEKREVKQENSTLRNELEIVKQKLDGHTMLENELNALRGENGRMVSKVEYLEVHCPSQLHLSFRFN